MAFQVTDLSETVPFTVTLKVSVLPVVVEVVAGDTVTEVMVGAVTVTVAEADFVVSATLVAVTVSVPVADGAVYAPADVIVPSFAFHVTDLFETLPETVAVNVALPPVMTDVVAGETPTEFTTGAATVTVADADFVVSAALVAVTVSVPPVVSAV